MAVTLHRKFLVTNRLEHAALLAHWNGMRPETFARQALLAFSRIDIRIATIQESEEMAREEARQATRSAPVDDDDAEMMDKSEAKPEPTEMPPPPAAPEPPKDPEPTT